MKPTLSNPWWWAACLASVAAGVWIGSFDSTTTDYVIEDASKQPLSRSVAMDDSGSVTRRILDRFDTDSLFKSLLEPGGVRDEVVKSLINREGWKAWPKVLAIEDPRLREKISASFLALYAQRDPWEAFAQWKKHRHDFPSDDWGTHAMMIITGTAAQTSAASLIEVFEGSPSDEGDIGISSAFADDLDFARVMDYIASSNSGRQVDVLNLLPAWAERSPLQAAKWIETHPDFVRDRASNSISALRQVVAADFQLSERAQALEALYALPSPIVNGVWAEVIESSAGIPQHSLLESATMMGRREDYLTAVLLEARRQGSLDQSWNIITPEERASIVEAADAAWDAGSSPVEMKSKERWRKMIEDAWETAP
jgi:hypothetical protein